MDLFGNSNGAEFENNHRYALWRIWDDQKPLLMWIGLNPSTANQETDDPTIRRLKSFSKSWGYGGFYICNLFSMVTPYPKHLNTQQDFVKADWWIQEIERKCEKVIFCWGNFHEAKHRAKKITELYEGYCLGINKNGSPKHPLYIKGNTELIRYSLTK